MRTPILIILATAVTVAFSYSLFFSDKTSSPTLAIGNADQHAELPKSSWQKPFSRSEKASTQGRLKNNATKPNEQYWNTDQTFEVKDISTNTKTDSTYSEEDSSTWNNTNSEKGSQPPATLEAYIADSVRNGSINIDDLSDEQRVIVQSILTQTSPTTTNAVSSSTGTEQTSSGNSTGQSLADNTLEPTTEQAQPTTNTAEPKATNPEPFDDSPASDTTEELVDQQQNPQSFNCPPAGQLPPYWNNAFNLSILQKQGCDISIY